jgi:hypothetical protein
MAFEPRADSQNQSLISAVNHEGLTAGTKNTKDTKIHFFFAICVTVVVVEGGPT